MQVIMETGTSWRTARTMKSGETGNTSMGREGKDLEQDTRNSMYSRTSLVESKLDKEERRQAAEDEAESAVL